VKTASCPIISIAVRIYNWPRCFPDVLLCWDSISILACFHVLPESPLTFSLSLCILFYSCHAQDSRKNSFITVLSFTIVSFFMFIALFLLLFFYSYILSFVFFPFCSSFSSTFCSSLYLLYNELSLHSFSSLYFSLIYVLFRFLHVPCVSVVTSSSRALRHLQTCLPQCYREC
jgi:hypothetical protein